MTVVDLFVLPKASEHTDVGFEIVWVRESESGISEKESSPLTCSSLFFSEITAGMFGVFLSGRVTYKESFYLLVAKKNNLKQKSKDIRNRPKKY